MPVACHTSTCMCKGREERDEIEIRKGEEEIVH
jgi:hypothetical protein